MQFPSHHHTFLAKLTSLNENGHTQRNRRQQRRDRAVSLPDLTETTHIETIGIDGPEDDRRCQHRYGKDQQGTGREQNGKNTAKQPGTDSASRNGGVAASIPPDEGTRSPAVSAPLSTRHDRYTAVIGVRRRFG
ncbi:hypothetical protein JCM9533A_03800 [Catenuloplanes niger JCM 9533]